MCVFFNDTATTEIYTLSLHDALPIFVPVAAADHDLRLPAVAGHLRPLLPAVPAPDRHPLVVREAAVPGRRDHPHPLLLRLHRLRSEEHTSELQSRQYLVCRLLLEKKK